MRRPIKRVVKVGGSLLEWPELPQRLWQWLHTQQPGENYLVAGGGKLADAIRHYDQLHQLGESVSHDMCIDVLAASAKMLQAILVQATQRYGKLPSKTSVVDVRDYLGLPGCELPHTWEATTDSIAAVIARHLAVDELVLLKSAAPDIPALTIELAAATGYVDRYFPAAMVANHFRWFRVVNLRATDISEWYLR